MVTRTASPSARLQERMRAERESLYLQAIIEAAERVFAIKGAKGSRMSEIAAEAGISLGTLYGVIEGKDSLFFDIHRARMLEFIDCISAERDAYEDTLDRHLAVLREGGRFFLDRPDFLRMCSRDGYGWSSRVPDVAGEANLWDEAATIPRELFQRGVDEGVYVAGDAGLLVRKMLALKQVELTHWVDVAPNTPHDVVLDQLEDQFVRAFCSSQYQRVAT
jgi:AcrR family transcriptional regulator